MVAFVDETYIIKQLFKSIINSFCEQFAERFHSTDPAPTYNVYNKQIL